MTFKILAFSCLVAAASAGLLPAAQVTYPASLSYTSHVGYADHLTYSAPVTKIAAVEEYDANPQYTYSYDVQDGHTGDSKSQHESRNGDVVQGSYSVVDPDGVKRTVEYTADPHNGFNAVVHREPVAVKTIAPVVTKVEAPVAYAATPVVHSAPIVPASPLSYSTPLYHH